MFVHRASELLALRCDGDALDRAIRTLTPIGLVRLSVRDPERIAPFTASVIHSKRASNPRALESEQNGFGDDKQALKKSNQSAAVRCLLW